MEYDVIVIGGGAVGMYTAFYCGLRQMKTLLCESMSNLGGQLSAIYPEKYIYDIPGQKAILAKDLIAGLRLQLESVNGFVDIQTDAQVLDIQKVSDREFDVTVNQTTVKTKAVIITAGAGAFTVRTLGLENEDKAKNIHYKVADMSVFKGKEVVVFGGGDSAVDWANMLVPIAKKVSIVHRRDAFRAKPHFVEVLENSNVTILKPYVAQKMELDDMGNIKSLTIKHTQNDETIDLHADEFLVNYGFTASIGAVTNFNVALENNKVVVNQKGETSVPGIYSCGDICTYNGRSSQITTGFGETINVTLAVKSYVDPTARNLPVR